MITPVSHAARPPQPTANRPVAIAVVARATGADAFQRSGDDATLEAGRTATAAVGYQTAVIKLVASAQTAEGRLVAARRGYEEGQVDKAGLHGAEADLEGAYARLRTLRDARPAGIDAAGLWDRHGMTVPAPPRQPMDLAWLRNAKDMAGSICGVGAMVGFVVFAQSTVPHVAMLGAAAFVVGGVLCGGLTLINGAFK